MKKVYLILSLVLSGTLLSISFMSTLVAVVMRLPLTAATDKINPGKLA